MGEIFLSTFPCSSKSDPQREFFGHRHRRIEWGAPMRPLKRAFPCYFFFYLFRDKRHLLQKQKCILKCHMRDRNPLQCQIKTWVAVSSWGQQNVRRVAKSLILYFCSQFWLCNHVSSNPLDQTWQMAPWQKEGGLRINHSGVPLWFMALCAGRNEKEIGHFLMFPAKRNTACCDLAQF